MGMTAPESPASNFETFLFSDIEGASMRWELDPASMTAALERHHDLMRSVVARHDGSLFKTVADACCVVFQRPEAAVAAAVEAQRLASREDLGGLNIRMAVHAGQVERRDGDYFGQPVNRVARLLAAAHGGQVVVSGIVTDLVQGMLPPQVTLRDLGQHRLKDLTRPEQIYQLLAPDLPQGFPPLRSLNALPNNLPQQVTSFIGRDAELAEVRALIERFPLVTLTGAGGLGKTRISLQVGADLLSGLRDGVWLLEMGPLTDGTLVSEKAASLFGLTVQFGRPTCETVADYLSDKRMLLILDNCEHVVGDAGELAAAILRAAPGVRLLVSGRQALALPEERTYRVPSLAVPERPDAITARQALAYGAVQLFVERAEAAVGSFVLTDDQAPIVVEICRRLDGIPLALELAAPRLKMLTPAGLLSRLTDRFRLLTGGDRTALPRHQTLKATLEWSYNLLTAHEQVMLQRLSVFGGGWTIDAAAAVTVGDPIEAEQVFDLVGSLIDKSLIVPVAGDSETGRYRLLESTRQFGGDLLRASGDTERRRRFAQFMYRLFEKADADWQKTPTDAWLARYEPELDNVRAALEWAFGEGNAHELGAQIASRTVQLLGELSLAAEVRRWSETALASAGAEIAPEVEGRILLAHLFGADYGNRRLEAPARRAVTLYQGTDDRLGLAMALRLLGAVTAGPGETDAALRYIAEAEQLLRALPPTKELASTLAARSVVSEFAGDVDQAMVMAEQSLVLARRLGHRAGVEILSANLAEIEFAQGRRDAAIKRAREALAAARRSGNLRLIAGILGNLAGYLLSAGNPREAASAALESLRSARALGWSYWIAICLEHLSLVAALDSRTYDAARLVGYTDAWYTAEGRVRQPTEQATWVRVSALLDAAFSKEERARFMAEGALWSERQAIEIAETTG
jgi:predicted ATPase/class 3 adenylate cyclase